MFHCKNIGIWCILLTLLETTKQFVLLEEDNFDSVGIPYDSRDLFNKDEVHYFPDNKHDVDEYPSIQKYAPFQREEREMQEYDDYRDEKDLPNLSRGGLSLFSWWKNDGDLKRPKAGTLPPLANEVNTTNATAAASANPNAATSSNTAASVESPATGETTAAAAANASLNVEATATANANLTVEATATANANPNAETTAAANADLTVNTTASTSANASDATAIGTKNAPDQAPSISNTDTNLAPATFETTCVCYNVTEECVPFFVATPVTCLGIGYDITSTASASNVGGDTANVSSSAIVSNITTSSSQNTTAAPPMGETTPGLNATAAAGMSNPSEGQNITGAATVSNPSEGQNTTGAATVSNPSEAHNTTGAATVSNPSEAHNTTGAATVSNPSEGQNTTGAVATSGATHELNTSPAAGVTNRKEGQNTIALAVITGAAAVQNTTIDQNAKSTLPIEGTSSSADSSIAIVTRPTPVNMFGAGMFLPVFEVPVTQMVAITKPSSSPTKKKKTHNKNDHNRHSQQAHSQLEHFTAYEVVHIAVSENNVNDDDRMLNSTPNTFSSSSQDNPTLLDPTKNLHYYVTVEIRDVSPSNILPFGKIAESNRSFLLDTIISQKQEKEMLKTKPTQSFLKTFNTSNNYHPLTFDQRLSSSNKQRNDLLKNKQVADSFYNLPQNKLNVYNYSNPSAIPAEPLKDLPYTIPTNYAVQNNILQTAENKSVTDIESLYGNFVKYNDTYLSKNSNLSINLVDLCKNVTCQGTNYLSQCCSRVFGPEKCQGEDFSYLHPIPGYFNTSMNTSYNQFDPLLMNQEGNNTKFPTTIQLLKQWLTTYTTETTKSSNCSCGSKPKSGRVVRENDMNDFVKFQLMHGMINPDGKEMMNALNEASLEMQKVNREFHSNDQGNIFKMNENGQNIHLPIIDNHRLSKKEPEVAAMPFSSNKIMDGLRATLSNGLQQSNFKLSPFQKDRYRFIRNQGLKDQMESIRENNMILDKIKKETEVELQRLCLLETKRREEEMLFDRKREIGLKELKTIQDIIHREFESRQQAVYPKRAVSDDTNKQIKLYETTEKENLHSQTAKNVDTSNGNGGMENFMLGGFSSLGSNTSNSFKGGGSNTVDIGKFPELEIKNSANTPHEDALLLLNIGPDLENLAEQLRRRRQGSNNAKNKSLKENIKSVHYTENNTDMLI